MTVCPHCPGNAAAAHCHAPLRLSEDRHRCAQVRLGRVRKRLDQWVIPQHLVDPRPLHPDPAPVNQPDFAEARLVCRADVFVHDQRNIAGRERVQVDRLFDWNAMHVYWCGYLTTTVVLMPPRGVNSPSTVIRFGAQAATRSSRIWLVALS
jgi:hypothetical protein